VLASPAGWRALCGLAAVASLVLAVIGLQEMFRAAHQPIGFLDALYGGVSLFVIQPPNLPQNMVGVANAYQVARFLAPAATLYALADALVLPMARIQARFARGHVVICGAGPSTYALAEKLNAGGRQVVLVTDADPGTFGWRGGGWGITQLVGDPTRSEVLRAAGVTRAARLYVVGPATARNASVLFTAAELALERRSPLSCYVEESDPDVFDALWMLTLRRPADDRLGIEFFNTARLGVRALLRDIAGAWTPEDDRPFAVAGLGPFGQELLVEIARRRATLSAGRLRVVVLDEAAGAVTAKLRARHGVVDKALDVVCADVLPEDANLDHLEHPGSPGQYVSQIFVCYEDEELALRTALATARPPSLRAVVVRVNRNNPLANALRPDRGEGLGPIDALYGDMIVFSEMDRLIDPAEAVDDRIEAIAAAIHAGYVRRRLELGEARGENEALVAWGNLAQKFRSGNVDQARDIEVKLRAVGLASARMTGDAVPFAFTEEEIERLSELEHGRWMRERVAEGWRLGPVRDNENLIHPEIRPYHELSDEERDKDTQAVRLIPELLAIAGYRVVRLDGPRP
jgi:hypothetical protein